MVVVRSCSQRRSSLSWMALGSSTFSSNSYARLGTVPPLLKEDDRRRRTRRGDTQSWRRRKGRGPRMTPLLHPHRARGQLRPWERNTAATTPCTQQPRNNLRLQRGSRPWTFLAWLAGAAVLPRTVGQDRIRSVNIHYKAPRPDRLLAARGAPKTKESSR